MSIVMTMFGGVALKIIIITILWLTNYNETVRASVAGEKQRGACSRIFCDRGWIVFSSCWIFFPAVGFFHQIISSLGCWTFNSRQWSWMRFCCREEDEACSPQDVALSGRVDFEQNCFCFVLIFLILSLMRSVAGWDLWAFSSCWLLDMARPRAKWRFFEIW